MKVRIIILVFLLVLFGIGVFFWFKEATSPVNSTDPKSDIFVIEQGEALRDVASRLEKEGYIRNSLAFFLLVRQSGQAKAIQAGDFRINTTMNAWEVLNELQHGSEDIWITIPEGWRNEEVALKLAGELQIPEKEFLNYAKEGYMFPDTYLFPRQATASEAAEIMLTNFDNKVMGELGEQIKQSDLTLNEILALASLIEREARHDEDRPIIASVLFNRLELGMGLDIDATLQYALGYQSEEKDWWKASLTSDDKLIDSPYNTYKNTGIPPGPIASPGLSSIRAVLMPAQTDFLYYISDKEGVNHYAETLEEHNSNVDRYLR